MDMEEQKTSKWFIILMVFLIALFLFLFIGKLFYKLLSPVDESVTIEDSYEDWSISFDLENFPESLAIWEYTDLDIRVLKYWKVFKEFDGYILFALMDDEWNFVELDDCFLANHWYYLFLPEDQWMKNFENWLRIDKAWKYTFAIYSIDWFGNSFDIVVQ